MGIEKRKHTRLDIHLKAVVEFPAGITVNGVTGNISFGGAYVISPDLAGLGNSGPCLLKLFLDATDVAEIEVDCQVVRQDRQGLGLKFMAIGIADYIHFEKLMVYNSPSPQKLMAELEETPGLVIESEK